MDEQRPASPESPARRIHAICLRFEDAWRAGPIPRIEDYLGEIDEPQRGTLLGELLLGELELRRDGGECQRNPGDDVTRVACGASPFALGCQRRPWSKET